MEIELPIRLFIFDSSYYYSDSLDEFKDKHDVVRHVYLKGYFSQQRTTNL